MLTRSFGADLEGGVLSARFAALSRRERLLFLGVLVCGLLAVWNQLVLRPMEASWKLLERREQELLGNLETLAVMEQQEQDRRVLLPRESAEMEEALTALRQRSAAAFPGVLGTAEAVRVLEQVLQGGGGVRLVEMTTQKPKVVFDGRQRKAWPDGEGERGSILRREEASSRANPTESRSHFPSEPEAEAARPESEPEATDSLLPVLYVHPIHLHIQGDYHEIVNYFNRIERSGVPLYWENMEYRVVNHPVAEVKVRVFTFGFDKSLYGLQ